MHEINAAAAAIGIAYHRSRPAKISGEYVFGPLVKSCEQDLEFFANISMESRSSESERPLRVHGFRFDGSLG